MLYLALRIDGDPTTWELKDGVESAVELPIDLDDLESPIDLAKFQDPIDLEVYHPFQGTLVLSPKGARSTVFFRVHVNATRPNGVAIGDGGALYVPSPHGPDVNSNPQNFYYLSGASDQRTPEEVEEGLKKLAGKIRNAMTEKKAIPVPFEKGAVVIDGAEVPFVVLCKPNIKKG